MPHLVSSCTSRSVSYSEKNSAMHTQTKVVWSCRNIRIYYTYSFEVTGYTYRILELLIDLRDNTQHIIQFLWQCIGINVCHA